MEYYGKQTEDLDIVTKKQLEDKAKLEQLNDVALVTLADGEVLTYDLTTGKWVNKAPSTPVTEYLTKIIYTLADKKFTITDKDGNETDITKEKLGLEEYIKDISYSSSDKTYVITKQDGTHLNITIEQLGVTDYLKAISYDSDNKKFIIKDVNGVETEITKEKLGADSVAIDNKTIIKNASDQLESKLLWENDQTKQVRVWQGTKEPSSTKTEGTIYFYPDEYVASEYIKSITYDDTNKKYIVKDQADTETEITKEKLGADSVAVDDTTISKNASEQLEVKDGGLTVAKMSASAVKTSETAGAVNDKLATQGYVDNYVSVSKNGTATDLINYITIGGVEKKIKNNRYLHSFKYHSTCSYWSILVINDSATPLTRESFANWLINNGFTSVNSTYNVGVGGITGTIQVTTPTGTSYVGSPATGAFASETSLFMKNNYNGKVEYTSAKDSNFVDYVIEL